MGGRKPAWVEGNEGTKCFIRGREGIKYLEGGTGLGEQESCSHKCTGIQEVHRVLKLVSDVARGH